MVFAVYRLIFNTLTLIFNTLTLIFNTLTLIFNTLTIIFSALARFKVDICSHLRLIRGWFSKYEPLPISAFIKTLIYSYLTTLA